MSRLMLACALVFMFCAGINAATHHWWGMASELAFAAVALWMRGQFEAA